MAETNHTRIPRAQHSCERNLIPSADCDECAEERAAAAERAEEPTPKQIGYASRLLARLDAVTMDSGYTASSRHDASEAAIRLRANLPAHNGAPSRDRLGQAIDNAEETLEGLEA